MVINFVGIFNQPGYVGETSDETHLASEMEHLGHTVNRVQRDVWKAYVDGEEVQKDWVLPVKADINIVAKWHHFNDAKYVNKLKEMSNAHVFLWVWDYMDDQGIPQWHINMAKASDLYLSGEQGIHDKYKALGINHYYFQFDVCDQVIPTFPHMPKENDVVFFGTYLGQGNRIEYLKKINDKYKVKIFSWNYEEWKKQGFDAYPAVYGIEFNKEVAKAKVILGFSVEANCRGYWSNRVGKVIRAGGCLLQEYAPGMEQFIGNCAEYFGSPAEAISKIEILLTNHGAAEGFRIRSREEGWRWTSRYKVAQLMILIDRYLKGDPSKWMI